MLESVVRVWTLLAHLHFNVFFFFYSLQKVIRENQFIKRKYLVYCLHFVEQCFLKFCHGMFWWVRFSFLIVSQVFWVDYWVFLGGIVGVFTGVPWVYLGSQRNNRGPFYENKRHWMCIREIGMNTVLMTYLQFIQWLVMR